MDKVQILGEYYPLDDLLLQNDIEVHTVVQWLVDEQMININDYFYDDTEELRDGAD